MSFRVGDIVEVINPLYPSFHGAELEVTVVGSNCTYSTILSATSLVLMPRVGEEGIMFFNNSLAMLGTATTSESAISRKILAEKGWGPV